MATAAQKTVGQKALEEINPYSARGTHQSPPLYCDLRISSPEAVNVSHFHSPFAVRAPMRALVQRVSEASVLVDGSITGQIGRGLLVFLGIKFDDTQPRADLLARKVIQLRIFPDDMDKMNRSLADISGELLVVPQFTLYGDTDKGNRPSYAHAAGSELAQPLFDYFVNVCRRTHISVSTGVFQAHMEVRLVNDGPVTLMCYAER